jgi:hypothetical protein
LQHDLALEGPARAHDREHVRARHAEPDGARTLDPWGGSCRNVQPAIAPMTRNANASRAHRRRLSGGQNPALLIRLLAHAPRFTPDRCGLPPSASRASA